MARIALIQVKDDMRAALEAVVQPFSDALALQGRSVLIKPNLVEPLPYTSGQTTNPALVEALVLWCRESGAAAIAVGEGPSYFQPQAALRDCFEQTGIADVAGRQAVPWILFDAESFRKFERYSLRTPDLFFVSEHAFSWDVLINVPVPKVHYLTGVSIAMKNLKGFLRRDDKPSFHHCGTEGIHGAVTELNTLVRPALTVVDCTSGVHQGKQFLLAGTDIVAVDTVMTSLMGINPHTIRTIRLGSLAGLGEMNMAKIDITGGEVKDFTMSFEQPADYLHRIFPGLVLRAGKACSGCLIPLFAALQRINDEGLGGLDGMSIVCGQEKARPAEARSIFIGQCTKGLGAGGPWLSGCPPTKEELYEFLKSNGLTP